MAQTATLMSLVLSIISVAVVYFSAFKFRLSWQAIIGVMVGMSLVIGLFNKVMFPASAKAGRGEAGLLASLMEVIFVSLLASIATLIILSMRFGFPMALGIVILSTIAEAVVRMVL
jgi:hypothetical protein